MTPEERDRLVKAVTKELADQGLLIEAGWQGLRLYILPADAPATQLADMRSAFFAGAQHLFASIMSTMDDGDDASAGDLHRMDLIERELRVFGKQLADRLGVDFTAT